MTNHSFCLQEKIANDKIYKKKETKKYLIKKTYTKNCISTISRRLATEYILKKRKILFIIKNNTTFSS